MLDIRVLTIFPDIFDSFLRFGNPARAMEAGFLKVSTVDIRSFATGPHRATDDYPYGGGTGMVMKPEPIVGAIAQETGSMINPRVILMTPQGRILKQAVAEELAQLDEMVLLCGRYEGVDERVRYFVQDEISVGDYILSGGETAAMTVIDAVSRLIPGVLGADSHVDGESFYDGILEYPQYTRPRVFQGLEVPQVLLEGNHALIKKWRTKQALARTLVRRPDLLKNRNWEPAQEKLLEEVRSELLSRTNGD